MTNTPEFDAFYRQYRLRVLRYVERRLSDPEAASEVCAECFVIAWRKFDPVTALTEIPQFCSLKFPTPGRFRT